MGQHISIIVAFIFLLPNVAKAFWIGDHTMITARAVTGLQDCGFLPKNWDQNLLTVLIQSNRDEDTNLLRKWTHYSHYYNPNKSLNMWRVDSSVTILETTDELMKMIQNNSQDSNSRLSMYQLMGRAIHHLQDAAVPAHVVPVSHFSSDGFEAYEVPGYQDRASTDIMYCNTLAETKPKNLQKILFSTATKTLQILDDSFYFKKNNELTKSTWSTAFWVQNNGADFGSYGSLQNNFGKDFFTIDGDNYFINDESFSSFKSRQLDAAVFATQEALLWMLGVSPYFE